MAIDKEKHSKIEAPGSPGSEDLHDETFGHDDGTLHRRLDNRQIQLIAIGGSIGTALFVSIGNGLARGGPASLLIAFTAYPMVLALVNNSIAEMTTYMPVSGGFIRLAGHWVDDALGFMAGWNFFFYEALLIPFEITALNLVLSFWEPKITAPGPTAGICAGVIICYALLNVLAVRAYGEAEFWLSGGKVILIFMLFMFTLVTMLGGNPQHDRYGFRWWKDPSAYPGFKDFDLGTVAGRPGAFAEYKTIGSLGRWEGFLAAVWNASFAVVGPEYISMVAAEAKRPRIFIKTAFKTIYFRFGLFFFGSALCVGIVLPWTYPALQDISNGGGDGTAAASPYVMAMRMMNIKVLPHIVNALMFTSIFSAGNTYTYCATRSLYGLALEGRAPRFLRKCTSNGVPIFCFAVVMLFPILSFLQVGKGSAEAISWFVTLITAGGIIDYLVMSVTFIFYYRACKAQGIDRKKMPYYGWFQPYCAYIAIAVHSLVVIFYGYRIFKPFTVEGFFQNYTMQIVAPILFFGWKFAKKTRFVKPHEADLSWEAPNIDAYEAKFTEPPLGFWTEMVQLIGFKRSSIPRDEPLS